MPNRSDSRYSFDATVAHWEALLAGAAANRDDLPALESYRAQLEAALKEAKELQARRISQESEGRRMTQDLHTRLTLGRELAARLESGVRLLYGRRSLKLSEFGMKALLLRGARKKASLGCVVKGCPLEASATAK